MQGQPVRDLEIVGDAGSSKVEPNGVDGCQQTSQFTSEVRQSTLTQDQQSLVDSSLERSNRLTPSSSTSSQHANNSSQSLDLAGTSKTRSGRPFSNLPTSVSSASCSTRRSRPRGRPRSRTTTVIEPSARGERGKQIPDSEDPVVARRSSKSGEGETKRRSSVSSSKFSDPKSFSIPFLRYTQDSEETSDLPQRSWKRKRTKAEAEHVDDEEWDKWKIVDMAEAFEYETIEGLSGRGALRKWGWWKEEVSNGEEETRGETKPGDSEESNSCERETFEIGSEKGSTLERKEGKDEEVAAVLVGLIDSQHSSTRNHQPLPTPTSTSTDLCSSSRQITEEPKPMHEEIGPSSKKLLRANREQRRHPSTLVSRTRSSNRLTLRQSTLPEIDEEESREEQDSSKKKRSRRQRSASTTPATPSRAGSISSCTSSEFFSILCQRIKSDLIA
ncbi:uncharacterized protein JCM6883_006181 [Sporobolomyces salmoneus]|uniref:uncharacterized protein n=1 Tax=Sporobolomyces salmoneus TaxID=183962 RepID=UPI003174A3F4